MNTLTNESFDTMDEEDVATPHPTRARVYDPEEGEPLNAEEARYVRNVCWGLAGALIGILLGVSHVAGWLRFP